jgi:hypothetical protein
MTIGMYNGIDEEEYNNNNPRPLETRVDVLDGSLCVDEASFSHTSEWPSTASGGTPIAKVRPCRNTDIMRARVHLDILESVCGAMIKKNIE